MKKKLKWAILPAVLAIAGSTAALTACNPKKPPEDHTHVYEWAWDDDEHWKECDADGAEEDGTRGEHFYENGECECGKEEPVEVKTYGKAEGQVKLHKKGSYETDFSDVTVAVSDSGAVCSLDTTGKFTITNLQAGKEHILTISKPGYNDYQMTVITETDQTATVSPTNGCVLEYKVFESFMGWDEDLHDYSHVNDEDPYIGFMAHSGDKSLNVITAESYDAVAASFNVKYNNSTFYRHNQGIAFKFEDGKHIVVRFYDNGTKSGIQLVDSLWEGVAADDKALIKDNTVFTETGFYDEWGERWLNEFSARQTTAVKDDAGDGLVLTASVKGGKLTVLFDGSKIAEQDLPTGYADKQVQAAFWAYNGGNGVDFKCEINEACDAALHLNVTKPQGSACAVTVNPQKQRYALGETVTLNISAPQGYYLDALTVNGEDKMSAVESNALSVVMDRSKVSVDATFKQIEYFKLGLTVKGKKLGKTTALPQGTQVMIGGISDPFTVDADGKITTADASFATGVYTVTVNGYCEKEIRIDKTLNELVLEYDLFESGVRDGVDTYRPEYIDKTHVNDADGYFIVNDGAGDLYQLTKTTYTDVTASVTYVKDLTVNNSSHYVSLVFGGNKAVMLRIQETSSGIKAQWMAGTLWNESGINTGIWDFGNGEEHFNPLSADLLSKYNSNGITLTLVRRGEYVYAYVDGKYAGYQTISGYAEQECRVCFAAMGVKGTHDVHFAISDTAEIPDGSVSAEIAGHTFGTNGNTITAGTSVTLSAPGFNDIVTSVVDENGVLKIKVDSLACVEWTVKADGYQNAKITVNKDQAYNEPIVLNSKSFSLVNNWSDTISSVHSEDGKTAQITMSNGSQTAFTNQKYGDVAVSIYLSAENMIKDNKVGNQGIVFRFDDNNMAILHMEKGEKIQFSKPDNNIGWILGGTKFAEGADYLDLIYFTGVNADPKASEYLQKYNNGTLKLTAVRKGAKIYAFLEDTLLGVFVYNSKYDTAQANVGLYIINTPDKVAQTRRFDLESNVSNVNAYLSANNADYENIAGGWIMPSDGKLNTYAGAKNLLLFKSDGSTTESATIHIKVGTNGHDQGLVYRFSNGKHIAVRYQNNNGNYKIQYHPDVPTYINDNGLIGWELNWSLSSNLTSERLTEFNNNGLDLTFIRDGNKFYVVFDGKVIDTKTLDESLYKNATGNMGITIGYTGSGGAFTYEHKSGDDVVIPTT